MKQLHFESYDEFVYEITDTFNSIEDEFGDVSIIAKYDEAKEIIREFLIVGYDIASVELYKEEFENYYDEYAIGLNSDGIWCEKFKRKNGYFINDSSVIYIMDNCSSKVIPYCKSNSIYEVSVCDDIEDDKTFVEYSKDNGGDTHGFTVSRNDDNGYHSYSYYTSEPLSQKDVQDMIKTFGFSLCE